MITGMKETLARLERAREGTGNSGLARLITLVTGQTHRYLMSLSASGTPPSTRGVLPVVSGRLKGDFIWDAHGPIGLVSSNIIYGPAVEARRGFLTRTVRDMQRPINNLVAAHVSKVTK